MSARRGQRSSRPKVRDVIAEQPPWEQPRMLLDPIRAVSDDELEAIHQASLRVLAETGIDFLDDTACRQLADAGADAVLAEYRPGELREPLGEQLQRLLRVAKGSRLVVREIGRGVDASRPLVPRR